MYKINSLSTNILALVIILSSACSTVHKNGYYQTKKYKHKTIAVDFKKKTKKDKEQRQNMRKLVNIINRDSTFHGSSEIIAQSYTQNKSAAQSFLIQRSFDIQVPSESHLTPALPKKYKRKKTIELSDNLKKTITELTENKKNNAKASVSSGSSIHWGALAGLTLSLLSFVMFGIPFSILGIIFSAIALINIKESPEVYSGEGLAIAGLVIGIIALVILLLLLGALLAIV